MRLVPCGCRLVICPKCGPRIAQERRKWLKAVTATWTQAVFLTLTVDQQGTATGKGFRSAEEAFDYVTQGRLVAKLMEKLGNPRWVAVLEFQENGWPHWHIVIDRRVDVNIVNRWWLRTWEVGCNKIERVKSAGGVASYLAGYLSKAPNLPEWAIERRIRFVSPSRAVMGLDRWRKLVKGKRCDQAKRCELRKRGPVVKRTRRERLAMCGESCVLLKERRSAVTGALEERKVGGKLPASTRSIARIAERLIGSPTWRPGEVVASREWGFQCEYRPVTWIWTGDWEPLPDYEGPDYAPPPDGFVWGEGRIHVKEKGRNKGRERFIRGVRPEDGGYRPQAGTGEWIPGTSVIERGRALVIGDAVLGKLMSLFEERQAA